MGIDRSLARTQYYLDGVASLTSKMLYDKNVTSLDKSVVLRLKGQMLIRISDLLCNDLSYEEIQSLLEDYFLSLVNDVRIEESKEVANVS